MSLVWANLVWFGVVTAFGIKAVVSDSPPIIALFWGIMIGCYGVLTAVEYANVRRKRRRSRLLP
jgi:hypothetical protein